jgi:hypothetical protein
VNSAILAEYRCLVIRFLTITIIYANLLSITIRIMELILVPKTNPSPCLSAFAIANSASIPRENSEGERERESGGTGLYMTFFLYN